MMELALATDYGMCQNSPENMEQQLKKLSDAGVTHVHWAYDWDFEYYYSIHEMYQIKELLDKYNLKVKGVHATEGNTRCRVVDGNPVFINRTRMMDNRKDISSPNVNTDQTEHTARRFSAWLPPIQCTLSGHQCMLIIQV